MKSDGKIHVRKPAERVVPAPAALNRPRHALDEHLFTNDRWTPRMKLVIAKALLDRRRR